MKGLLERVSEVPYPGVPLPLRLALLRQAVSLRQRYPGDWLQRTVVAVGGSAAVPPNVGKITMKQCTAAMNRVWVLLVSGARDPGDGETSGSGTCPQCCRSSSTCCIEFKFVPVPGVVTFLVGHSFF